MSRFDAGELFQGVVALGLVCGLSALFPLLGFLIFGAGIWAVPYGVVRGLVQSARGKPDPTRTAWWWVRGLVVGVLAIAGSLAAMGQRLRDCETRAAPVIAALQQFKTRTGAYPEKLAALVPGDLARIPDGVTDEFGFEVVAYQRYANKREASDAYSLTYFPVFGLPLRHTYGPQSGRWMTWD